VIKIERKKEPHFLRRKKYHHLFNSPISKKWLLECPDNPSKKVVLGIKVTSKLFNC